MQILVPNAERAKAYYAKGYWQSETIPLRFDKIAKAAPDAIALTDAAGTRLSYRELHIKVETLAAYFVKAGLGDGDIITLCAPNWPQTVISILASLRIGAIINPIPITYGWKDVQFVLRKCKSKALIIAGRFRSSDLSAHMDDILGEERSDLLIVQINTGAKQVGKDFDSLIDAPAICPVALPNKPDDTAAILFTSGTEAHSKGVVHTHNTILYCERCFIDTLALDENDTCFMASPISHATGFLHGVVLTLTTGGHLSLLDKFEAEAAAKQMARDKTTWTMGATPFLNETLLALNEHNLTLPDLRFFLCGGAPVPEISVRKAMEGGLRILSVYGATESPPHTVVWPSDPPENAWLTDGRAAGPGVEIKIVDPEGNTCPQGAIGEEWSRGPHAFLGYLDDPEITSNALNEEGWYRSGDLAYQTEDGSIRITGRIKDMIVRGGQNIAVREVEELLAKFPGCVDCALVGIPHERLGETGCAILVMKDERHVSVEDIYNFLTKLGVAKFKIPERIECWPDLPKTPSGKIQKFKIREIIEQQSLAGTRQ